MDSRETLLEIGKLPRDTTNAYEKMALLAYDRGCREGHGPYKSIAWDLAVEIYRLSPDRRQGNNMPCNDDVVEMDVATHADGLYPLCLQAKLTAQIGETERLAMGWNKASDEIDRLKVEGCRFANWIEGLYGDLPRDRPPGPPIQLLIEMRSAFA